MKDKVVENVRTNIRNYMIGVIVVVIILFGVITYQPVEEYVPYVPIEEEIENVFEYIFIDIKGEVYNPGVYKVLKNTRLFQVIELAGGLTNDANSLVVNLSLTLKDEDVVYIPKIGEDIKDIVIDDVLSQEEELLDINRANIDQLSTLPGIGPSTAQKIIDYRDEYGYFENIDEIMNVSGIGESTFHGIQDLIQT